ncbi:hypothetical protein IVB18_33015 [Bradyrhizobium sp. 186]|uniref:hypothetical protein n=1 Tax=Bradyrhizobium sp. 186 TaxID=2782654 RepID=UPI0020497FE9|nr:hypothetical protein IVB18_33015 [Bradyrhizobium sp. 186]
MEFKPALDTIEPALMPHQRGMNPRNLLEDTGDLLASRILGRPQRQHFLLHFVDLAINLRQSRLDRFQHLEHQVCRHVGH